MQMSRSCITCNGCTSSFVHSLSMVLLCDPVWWSMQPRWIGDALEWTVASVYQYHWNGFIVILFLRLQIHFNGPSMGGWYTKYNRISTIVICTATAGHTV